MLGYVGPNGFIHVKGYPEISKPSKRARNAEPARKSYAKKNLREVEDI